MRKREALLVALSAHGNYEYTPVQVQKMLFLIERNIAKEIGGTGFTFIPFDYGPFDASVYEELRVLAAEGLLVSAPTARGWPTHTLTPAGFEEGNRLAASLSDRARAYIKELSSFVRNHSFRDLVSAIYEAYPEMKANSVFRG